MAYRNELELRIAKKTTRAIVDFAMLENGDRVMVGLSGGKDSWALLQILDVLRQRAPVGFSLIAVNVDSGYKEYKHDLIATTRGAPPLGIPHRAHRHRRGDRGHPRRRPDPLLVV